MAIAKQITFEGLKYNLDNEDRLAAEVAHQSAGQKVLVETVTGAGGTKTLVAGDSGKLFVINAADGTQTFTLPATADSAGWNAKFIFTTGTHDEDVTFTADGDNMIISATAFTGSGNAQSHFTNTHTNLIIDVSNANPVAGDRVEFYCDGTNWYAIGFSNGQGTSMWTGS